MRLTPLCVCASVFLAACGGGKGTTALTTAADSADEVIWGLKQNLTSLGVKQAYLKAESAFVYEAAGRVDLRKVTVTFFTTEGVQTSVLTAATGVVWTRTNLMSARGNVVVVRTSDGARLQTEFLQYDPAKAEVTTDRPYVADKGVQHFEGVGFTCDPGFINCSTHNARGSAGQLVMPAR